MLGARTGIGIDGLLMVVAALSTTSSLLRDHRDAFHVLLGIISFAGPLLLGAYFLFTGVLAWRPFSPAAVQHFCVALAFIFYGLMLSAITMPDRAPPLRVQALYLLLFIGLGIVSYVAFRCCRFILRRTLFPPQEAYPATGGNAASPRASV